MTKLLDELCTTYGTDDSGAAKLLGLDKSTVSRYRNGNIMPKGVEYHAIALIHASKKERDKLRKERIK